MNSPRIWMGIAVVALAGAAGCSDGTGPNGGPRVGLLVSTAPSAATAPGFAPESVKVGNHTLVFQKVELVLREIELKRVAGTAGCSGKSGEAPAFSSGDEGKGKTGSGNDPDRQDDCFEFEFGPLLLDLPLGKTPQRVVTIDVDSGSYREVEFKVHAPSKGGEDQAFVTAHPDFDGVSVRVVGTYDGKPFTFKSRVSAKQEHLIDPPLVVGAKGATDLTLLVEIGSWFIAGGVGLIDPATAGPGGPNNDVVARNIQRSFRIFEDRDHDGRKDS